ncbi:ABC transporter ATP-binding protein [Gemmatimonas sp.]|uniref:ABC transporter ATP-binding protein n=1 Tax=Gemmatimonas sp. TaxID=1962908 RepID=UPI00286D6CF1|nr:ABC transporter ATP-binding protein [Gemmatimonas sp.]
MIGATIVLRDLSLIYETSRIRTSAVTNLTLTIAAGDYCAVIGESGSGKSSLLGVLALLQRPTYGSYDLDGRDCLTLTARERAQMRATAIGLVYQSSNLVPELTLLDNVALPMRYARVNKEERVARAAAALESVGLGHRLSHFPDEVSGGQQQRAAIARTIAQKPRLLLADEPTGNLDSESGAEVMRLLGELNAEGTTVVLVTHSEEYAQRARKRVLMRDGAAVQIGE